MGSTTPRDTRWLRLSGVFFALVLPRLASAQGAPSVTLFGAGITHSTVRDDFRTNDLLNHNDCVNGDNVSFPLSLTSRGSYRLDAWVGSNCASVVERTTPSLGCRRVFSELPLDNSRVVTVPVRSMVARYTSISTTTSMTEMNSDAGAGTIVQAGPEACVQSDPQPFGTPIELYFMLIDPSDEEVVGTFATWTGKFKLAGPYPPDEITAAAGAKRLVVHFAYDNGQATDQTINGYNFYCDPTPGTQPLPAADAGAACDSTHPTVLVPGALPDSAYRCGSAALTAVSANITGLQSGVAYRVAMAATDTYANLGPLSAVTCGVPVADDPNVSACSFSPRRRSRHGSFALLSLTLAGWRLSRWRAPKRGAAQSARRQ